MDRHASCEDAVDTLDTGTGVSIGPVVYGDYIIENSVDIALFSGVDTISGGLYTYYSNHLINLDGLESLTTVEGDLYIYGNESLTNRG